MLFMKGLNWLNPTGGATGATKRQDTGTNTTAHGAVNELDYFLLIGFASLPSACPSGDIAVEAAACTVSCLPISSLDFYIG